MGDDNEEDPIIYVCPSIAVTIDKPDHCLELVLSWLEVYLNPDRNKSLTLWQFSTSKSPKIYQHQLGMQGFEDDSVDARIFNTIAYISFPYPATDLLPSFE